MLNQNDERRFTHKVLNTGQCWLWLGHRDKQGYGGFQLQIDGVNKWCKAHRISYQHYVEPIPDGLVIDHLCRNTSCVNPQHLEPVTVGENNRRGINRNKMKTHCPRNHPYDEANTYLDRNGSRICRACHNERERNRKRKIRGRQ